MNLLHEWPWALPTNPQINHALASTYWRSKYGRCPWINKSTNRFASSTLPRLHCFSCLWCSFDALFKRIELSWRCKQEDARFMEINMDMPCAFGDFKNVHIVSVFMMMWCAQFGMHFTHAWIWYKSPREYFYACKSCVWISNMLPMQSPFTMGEGLY